MNIPNSSPVAAGERVSDERLAAIVTGQIYGADAILLMARELQERRASSPPAGRDEIIALYVDPSDVRPEHQALVNEIQAKAALKEQP
jgi:hypothetical protein